jgi:hypothetical protein
VVLTNLSADNFSGNSNFRLYPNPARNRLQIISNSNMEEIKIYGASGKLLRAVQLNALSAEINMEGLSDGIYYLQARFQNNEFAVRRFSVIK